MKTLPLLFCATLALSQAAYAGQGKAKPATAELKLVAASRGDVAQGRLKVETERCQECHGIDGHASGTGDGVASEGKFPKLAGQFAEYMVKQVRDFRSGARKHDFMAIMARSLDDCDLLDIAAYYASQPTMAGEAGTGAGNAARKLFLQGDPSRQIPACASCHGESGKGQAVPLTPVIGGQHWRYLQKQLLDWRSGERNNSAGGVMSTLTKSLTDVEIEALATYLSGL